MNKIHSCISESDLQAIEHNQLSQKQLEAFESHLSSCAKCRDRFDATDNHPLPLWESEICPALRDTFDLGLPETRTDDTANHETFLQLLSPSEDPRMLGRIGNYEVVGIIGQGGMGVVFKAFETSLNRFVAIKMLLPHLTANAAARKRFLREAQAAAAVVDDHVLPIFGVDQWQETPYLVMKYSGGQTLQQRITQQGPMELKEVLRIGTQAAKGLAAAHAQGLVHRDIKPSNILLDGGVDRAVLMDFGLARAVDDASLTRTGIISGTPQYMSPEQVRADSVDARSDLFSLGSTLYAMCAGRPPFRSESAYGVMHRITHEDPTPICEVNSDVPIWMGHIIHRLMSKTAEDRYESADEVAELLEGCLAHVQQPTTADLPETLKMTMASQSGGSSWRRWAIVALCAFFFALAGILLIIELNKGQLIIECAADDVPVRIMQGDVEVEKLTVSKDGATVKVAAGNYVVEIEDGSDEFVLENGVATLSRGGVKTVTISLKGAVNSDSVAGAWVPPINPNLKKIIAGAKKDTRDGNYQIALAKYVWHHENAHLIEPNGYSQQYSAIRDWLELGEEYPPALAKMREVRDATEAKVRDRKGGKIDFPSFQAFQLLNRTLRDPQRTVELFKWIEEVDFDYAAIVYDVAKESLLLRQEYETCSKYTNPTFDVKKICFDYEEELNRASKSKHTSINRFRDYAGDKFVGDSATIVEILSNVDRDDEARYVIDRLREYVKGKDIYDRLDKALEAAMKKKAPLEPSSVRAENDTDANSRTELEETQATADSDVADWTPPEDPQPDKILDEAVEDKQSGNFSTALAKHVWYHNNALRIQPGLTGVRLSSAMSDWFKLGEAYPPARAKMEEMRDALEVKIRDKNRVRVRFQDFHEIAAFNRTLNQEQLTADLFRWLDGYNPEDAERIYPIAQASLLKEQDYELCGKYTDPFERVDKICFFYNLGSKRLSKSGKPYLDHVEKSFVGDSAILIEILVMNGNKAEALKAADRLKEFAKDEDCFKRLEEAITVALEKEPHQ